ncbi:MAG TPA: cell division protein SepF [Actinomycetaceae bacterium]|nr:cell division protein SepF [Actinomycetaceae bacterium]
MAGALRKTMAYLGFAEQHPEADEYEYEYEDSPVEDDEHTTSRVLTAVPRVAEPELARIVTVHPSTYNEAREIGEAFRDGIPVILNLTGMSEPDAKRMVDFSAGLVFGLHGGIERVTNRVFLLSPQSVQVETETREDERGARRFFNQA